MCICSFDGIRIDSDRIMTFELSHFRQFFCIVGYRVCVINSSFSFQWVFLKPCILVVDIMKIGMWVFDGCRINSEGITAF